MIRPNRLPENSVDLRESVRNFVRAWKNLDETSKELIASGFHMLTLQPGEILEGISEARFVLTPEKSQLLHQLADFTREQ